MSMFPKGATFTVLLRPAASCCRRCAVMAIAFEQVAGMKSLLCALAQVKSSARLNWVWI